jgi:branched-chain amino acid transport system substrate-binding protein
MERRPASIPHCPPCSAGTRVVIPLRLLSVEGTLLGLELYSTEEEPMKSMRVTRTLPLLGLAAALLAIPPSHAGEKRYGPGVTDTEIKLGNTMPYSGPASAIGLIGHTIAAYWRKVNDNGGINGRRISFISVDDSYSPPKTVEQIRKLVEQEQVAFIAAPLGTPTNVAVQKYLNARKVPQLFLISAASRWNDPKNYPWSMSLTWGPNYHSEGSLHAQYLQRTHPASKVAVLYQNDDSGKDLLRGLEDGFASEARRAIVARASFEVTDPTVDSQIVALHASGADALVIYSVTPKACAQAIRKAYDLGWRPVRLLFSGCVHREAVLTPAGLDRSTGLLAMIAMKQITEQSMSDPAVKVYLEFMAKYFPDGKPAEGYCIYGYTLAQALEEVLRRAGDDLTRESIMRHAANLRSLALPMFLPGITVNTSPTDYATIQESFINRFDGKDWVPFGDMLSGP